MSSRSVIISTVILGLLFLAGCTQKAEPPKSTDPATTPPPASVPAEPKKLTVGFSPSIATLDVHKQGKIEEMSVLVNIYDTLVWRDREGKLQPSLATEWKAIDDKTWEFKIRQGVKFHNGEELDANAVKYSLDRVMNPDTKSPITEFRNFDRIEAPDQWTVRVITKTVDPMVPDKLSLFGGSVVPPKYTAENPDNLSRKPVGTGPFVFVEYQKDDHLTLEANKGYWGGAPKIDSLTFRFLPDAADRVAALLGGQVDLINEVPPEAIAQVNGKSTRLEAVEGVRLYYMSIAYPDGPTADVNVRRAISYAIDTKLLADKVMGGYAAPTGAPQSKTHFGYNPDVQPYPYDPEKAKSLLATAGFPNGFTLKAQTTPEAKDLLEAVEGMLAKVNIKLDLQVMPRTEFTPLYSDGKLAPVWTNSYTIWQGSAETLIDSFFKAGRPRAKWSTPEMEALINTANGTTNATVRQEAIRKMMTLLHDEAPWVYLYNSKDLYGVSSKVTWNPPTNRMLKFTDIDLK